MTSLPTQPTSDLEISPDPSVSGLPAEAAEPKLKKKKKKKTKRSKGVETLFRTSLASHLKLSEMADQKANLMISINTILVSITLSSFVQKMDVSEVLFLPSVLLLTVCLVTIVVSLLATNPTLSMKLTAEAPINRKIDLLFFNDYVHLSPSEFRRGLQELIADEDQLYTSLINNIYAQGKVLSRKYRRLKFAYSFFTVGFSGVVLLAIGILLFKH